MEVKKLEDLLQDDYKELTDLIDTWKPEAKKEETAVNALVKLIQQREQVATNYHSIKPDEESTLVEFRKKNDDRRKKNKSNLK